MAGVRTKMHEDIEVALADLVSRSRQGDQRAWSAIVDRFSGLVWSVARSFGLPRSEAADVTQTTWLRLAEHLDRIQNPERLAAWLVTTARREAMRQRRRLDLARPSDERALELRLGPAAPADRRALIEERDAALCAALAQLPERSRLLLTMLVSDPPMSYNDISEALEISVGSIGPTRARALAALRGHIEEAGVGIDD